MVGSCMGIYGNLEVTWHHILLNKKWVPMGAPPAGQGLRAHANCILRPLSLVEKAETVYVHFLLQGEGPRVQRNYHG